MSAPQHIPVNVLTGFLGSGKTTLLKRLLGEPAFDNCAVLINELGEIGLDHLLLDRVENRPENETVVLQNGCICCGVRDDLRQALRDLYDRREQGVIPAFDRVIIETTGLADPMPVLATIDIDPVLRHHYRLGNVVTTIDAVNAQQQQTEHDEWTAQVAVADRLVITKADLADPNRIEAVRSALREVNAPAWICVSSGNVGDADVLLGEDAGAKHIDEKEVRRWFPKGLLNPDSVGARTERLVPWRPPAAAHTPGVSTLALTFDEPLDWVAFGIWLSMLLNSRGADIFRVKGILWLRDADAPIAVHGVRHIVHPPVHLPAWPGDDRQSRLVFIGRLPQRAAVMESLRAFGVCGL